MARWRTDKRPEEADTLETVRALIEGDAEGGTMGARSDA
jgi:hypothetical protein